MKRRLNSTATAPFYAHVPAGPLAGTRCSAPAHRLAARPVCAGCASCRRPAQSLPWSLLGKASSSQCAAAAGSCSWNTPGPSAQRGQFTDVRPVRRLAPAQRWVWIRCQNPGARWPAPGKRSPSGQGRDQRTRSRPRRSKGSSSAIWSLSGKAGRCAQRGAGRGGRLAPRRRRVRHHGPFVQLALQRLPVLRSMGASAICARPPYAGSTPTGSVAVASQPALNQGSPARLW